MDKDLERNILYVVQGDLHPALMSTGLIARGMNWISGTAPVGKLVCTAKFRYRQPDQGVSLVQDEDGSCHITFDQPQRAITPGQAVVLYSGDVCLGGGTIDEVIRPHPIVNR